MCDFLESVLEVSFFSVGSALDRVDRDSALLVAKINWVRLTIITFGLISSRFSGAVISGGSSSLLLLSLSGSSPEMAVS